MSFAGTAHGGDLFDGRIEREGWRHGSAAGGQGCPGPFARRSVPRVRRSFNSDLLVMGAPPMNASLTILRFGNVTVQSSPDYETGLSDISFALNPGDLLLVRIERENERLPLADATEGLAPPAQGTVSFLGANWQSLSADHAAAHRGKIGRLFDDEGWVSDIDVDENIMLAQRHH